MKYVSPEMDKIAVRAADVITTSNDNYGGGTVLPEI